MTKQLQQQRQQKKFVQMEVDTKQYKEKNWDEALIQILDTKIRSILNQGKVNKS